jgi:anti-anti-sigma factor
MSATLPGPGAAARRSGCAGSGTGRSSDVGRWVQGTAQLSTHAHDFQAGAVTSTDDQPFADTLSARVARGGPGLCVRLASYPRPPALVVEVGGEVDAFDADRVSDYLVGFVHGDRPLILDFTGVNFLDVAGFRSLLRFAAECRRAELEWVLVASDALNLLMRVAPHFRLPVVSSLEEALKRVSTMPNAEFRLRSAMSRQSTRR